MGWVFETHRIDLGLYELHLPNQSWIWELLVFWGISKSPFPSWSRGPFGISWLGKDRKEDFNIKEEANGTGESHEDFFNDVSVTDHNLEIRLYWVGKGTTFIP
ncbi:hypothetical protein FEM48_Zijuj01G0045500 [Ziziphus jujuba var. spinosa]|uniref:Malectin domain-containing protein n=1 Tax=Ziziphus jujuba var. spinosa TaxID=714518 RepID=A0A978VZ62_ZIZJJ|nr:hypothetical protein FEM48_Zijuj01G0045500 [Ziziphus jujuba var. spinosa]